MMNFWFQQVNLAIKCLRETLTVGPVGNMENIEKNKKKSKRRKRTIPEKMQHESNTEELKINLTIQVVEILNHQRLLIHKQNT